MPWNPIAALRNEDRRIYVGDADALRATFDAARADAEAHHADVAQTLQRLKREMAIETGILEHIYDIERGTTNLLIERGFIADLIERQPGQRSPTELVAILHDHHDAIELVYDWVSRRRPLTLHGIRELHQILTRNQPTVDGIDPTGRVVQRPLLAGQWKKLPNNPTRPDGAVHEYCPPVHVQSEMERLLALLAEYGDVHPLIAAAWLHHRFAQIHPFEDGNGRVARCLMNFVLIRGGFVPAVIRRDDRVPYLDALEAADAGRLEPLVRMLAQRMARRMVQLAAEVTDLRHGVEKLTRGKPISAEAAATRIARKRRVRGAAAAAITSTQWLTTVVAMVGRIVDAKVASANRWFESALGERVVSATSKEFGNGAVWIVAMEKEPATLQLAAIALPVEGGGALVFDVPPDLAQLVEPLDYLVEDRGAVVAPAEPLAQVELRLAQFIDDRIGAWLSEIG